MMKISNRLMSIDMNEMERLTNETRKILLWAYLSRRIAPPFWVVAPKAPPNRTGEATAAPKSRLGTIGLLSQI
jgi:hypothetical protein